MGRFGLGLGLGFSGRGRGGGAPSYLFTNHVIILAAGQSNEAGSAGNTTVDPILDASDPRILCWEVGGSSAVELTYPIPWPSPSGGVALRGPAPSVEFARTILPYIDPAYSVIIIPAAVGDTQLVGSVWAAPSGTRYVAARDALAACLAAYPGATVLCSWTQGEADAQSSIARSNYTAAFTSMVSGFRAVSGASGMPMMMHGMVPEWVTGGTGTAVDIQKALASMPTTVADCYYVGSPTGYAKAGDTIHFDAPGSRRSGVDRAKVWLNVMRAALGKAHVYINSEAAAFAAQIAGTVAGERKIELDRIYSALKYGNIYGVNSLQYLDALVRFDEANEQEALLNYIAGSPAPTKIGAPTFTAGVGYSTDGVDDQIDTNFNPSTAGGHFARDNALFGVRSNKVGTTSASIAGFYNGTDGVSLASRNATNNSAVRMNQAASTSGSTNTDGSGWLIGTRTGSSAGALYLRGTQVATIATASTAIANGTLRLGGINGTSFAAHDFGGYAIGGVTGGVVTDVESACNDRYSA